MTWPEITSQHERAVSRVLASNRWVDGPETRALEEEAAEALGWRHATFLSNGTTALTAALAVCGVSPDSCSLVAMPALTFSGTAYAALALGADLRFVDVGPEYVVEEWPEDIDFAIPVHLHGRVAPAPPDRIRYVIDDSCQAPRARTANSVAACVSLNQSKTLWGGEGGLLLTDDEGFDVDVKARRRFGERDWGDRDRPYISVVETAGNWRGTEMSAALTRASLLHLERWESQSERAAETLSWAVEQSPLIEGPDLSGYRGVHKYRVMAPAIEDVPQLMKSLRSGVGVPVARWGELALSDMPAFRNWESTCPVARDIVERSLIIGDESNPLCVTTEDEAARWASQIQEVCR